MVVASENAGTALAWNPNWRCQTETWLWRFKFGISGFYGNVNEGWDESSVVHRIPTD